MKLKTIEWDFKPIAKPGLYSKVPMGLYHSAKICDAPSVSSSGLRRLFALSPAHFYAQWPGNPDFEQKDDKPHFVLGRAAHHLMLGEPYFAKLFAEQPAEYPDSKTGEMKPWSNNSNFAKDWHAKMSKAGRAVVTRDQVISLRGMADSLSRNPIIQAGALNGMIERSIFFKDKETKLWVKVRPDSIPTSSIDFVDLKTTTSVLWKDMQRTIAEMGYFQQGALIRTAAREVLGIDRPTFTLVFVEKTSPYCVRVVTLKDNDLDRGERANRFALDTIARCMKSKQWPGPGGEREDAISIELPEWSQKQVDDKLEFELS
jgi:PDDEXK-like domain of unknown function (DUF3799)